MITRFLTRYSVRYPRTLVYMLQASEYDLKEFSAWYGRVRDFRAVERRKSIDWTTKATALYRGALAFLCLSGLLVLLGLALHSALSVLGAAVVILLAPLALPAVLAAAVRLGAYIQRPMERRAIDAARKRLRAHPGIKIAIAGSYGKTTMREIVKTVLSAGKRVAAPPGSHNTPLAIASFIQSLTREEEIIIFELGEYYPGDVRALCDIVEPDIGIITGVNEAHLSKFGTLEATAGTIFELADYLRGKPLYVNAENDIVAQNAPEGAIHFSREMIGDWRIDDAQSDLDGTQFTVREHGIAISASSKLLGLHMVGPIAAAAHLGRELGLTVAQVEDGIAQTTAFAHRLEPRRDASGVTTIDDSYNGNPDGVRAAIEFLASLRARRIYVTPGLVEMGARAEAVHTSIGRQLAEAGIEHVILVRNSVTPWIARGLEESGFSGKLTWFEDGPSAYAALPLLTALGDVVLLQNDWPDQYA